MNRRVPCHAETTPAAKTRPHGLTPSLNPQGFFAHGTVFHRWSLDRHALPVGESAVVQLTGVAGDDGWVAVGVQEFEQAGVWSLKRLRQAERSHSMIRFGLLEKIGRDESPLRSPRYGVAHLGGIMGGKNYLQMMRGE